jgi:hypothetical protein
METRFVVAVPANTLDLGEGDFVDVVCSCRSEEEAEELDAHNFAPFHSVFDAIVKKRLGSDWEASIEDRFNIVDFPDVEAKTDVYLSSAQ